MAETESRRDTVAELNIPCRLILQKQNALRGPPNCLLALFGSNNASLVFRRSNLWCIWFDFSRSAVFSGTLTHLLFILIILGAVIGGGGLSLFGFFMSAPSQTLGGPVTPAQHFSGWSRPKFPDHADLAALEQQQLEKARARRGWRPISRALSSHFDKRTHRRSPPATGEGTLIDVSLPSPHRAVYISASPASDRFFCSMRHSLAAAAVGWWRRQRPASVRRRQSGGGRAKAAAAAATAPAAAGQAERQ